ncbi:MAG: hypothetical protein FWC29_06190 [Methanomassiliicoccaceae archaeon]|nr:hypothetical protein [Methanomassiliicoccaceae archaeon]
MVCRQNLTVTEDVGEILNAMAGYLLGDEEFKKIFEENRNRFEKCMKEKTYTLDYHIRGLVYSKLSQGAKWSSIERKLEDIDRAFYDWNTDKILEELERGRGWEYFFEELRKIQVGRFRKKLCESLHDNIITIRDLLKIHSAEGPEYFEECVKGLRGYGPALVAEYLIYVGVDRIKPDVHVKRFLKRVFGIEPSSDIDIIEWGKEAKNKTGLCLSNIDWIIWEFCRSVDAGQSAHSGIERPICTDEPKCGLCCIRESCKYHRERQRIMSVSN